MNVRIISLNMHAILCLLIEKDALWNLVILC